MGRRAGLGNFAAARHSASMPLRCLNDARDTVYAFDLSETAWALLGAENRARRHLRTHCCDVPVALKTSRLGTRFFAHLARGGCATGDETPEHLHLKWLAVQAAQRHGWTAATEVAGTTPGGEPWRADVLATRGRHRVAVEVQWSPQDDAETRRRQARYADSGVRGLWLFRGDHLQDAATPAMRVRGSLATGFTAFGVPIADALDAAFDRRLGFGIPTGRTATVAVAAVVLTCWHPDCGAMNRPVSDVAIGYGVNVCEVALKDLTDFPGVADAIVRHLPPDPARGRIRLRASRTAGETYLANACFRCDRLLGDGFLSGARASRTVIARFPVTIDAAWRAAIDGVRGFAPVWSIAPAPASR